MTGPTNVEHAVALSRRYSVFPVSASSKRPALSNKTIERVLGVKLPVGGGGHNAASQDEAVIRLLFREAGPTARVGVNCAASGIVVLDVDRYKNPKVVDAFLLKHSAIRKYAWRIHRTPSGGRHYIYASPPGVTYGSRLDGFEYCDVKHNGYIIWPSGEEDDGYAVVSVAEEESYIPQTLINRMQVRPATSNAGATTGNSATNDILIQAILDGADYHSALLTLSMRLVQDDLDNGETPDAEVTTGLLRDLVMRSTPGPDREERKEQLLEGTEIERLVASAIAKKVEQEKDPLDDLGELTPAMLDALGGSLFAPVGVPGKSVATLVQELAEDEPLEAVDVDLTYVPGDDIPPPRRWLHGHHMIRGHISVTTAPGGLGKSSAVLAECVDVAIQEGRITGQAIYRRPLNVLYINGEDPLDEIQRRVAALRIEYGISAADWGNRLHIVSGRDLDLCLIEEREKEVRQRDGAVKNLVSLVAKTKADIVVLDPLTSFHNVSENSNTSIVELLRILHGVIHQYNCAMHLVHHSVKVAQAGAMGKILGAAQTRGASALLDGARAVRTLRHLTGEENEECGLPKKDTSVIRVATGKGNMALTGTGYQFRLESVQLNNGDDEHPDGDSVGVLKRYEVDLAQVAIDQMGTQEAAIRWLGTLDKSATYRAAGASGRRPRDWLGWDLMAAVEEVNTEQDAAKALGVLEGLGYLTRVKAKDSGRGREIPVYRVTV